ncbi:MAG: M20/M25/M40 family metallo-hydrolase [Bacteroidetes bacterium]|nr:M20/M25/M40 family metallo-hydrolase [Bacteroidota bacterium]
MKQTITSIFLYCLYALITNVKVLGQDVQDTYVADVEYTKEINKLLRNKKIKSAFELVDIMDPRSMRDLVYLTEIPAPPFMEGIRAVAFRDLLSEAGIDSVWIDEVGNVIGLKYGTNGERNVVLDAHLDTVFPEGTDVTIKFKGDTLMAPGIGDDTRGLVVVLSVFRAMKMAEIETSDNIWIVGSVGEEGLGDLRGVKHLFREGATKIDSWISVDGGEIGRLTNKGLGSNRYRVTITGPGGHSWGAFGLGNPHHALGLAIQKFDKVAMEFTSKGPRTSYNVGRIGGGTSVNSIPFESWMEVDMRSVDPKSLDAIDVLFKESMNAAIEEINANRRSGDALILEVDKIGERPSGELPLSLPLIQRAIAVTNSFGVNPKVGIGSTNSNIPISLGIPAVTIGRGGVGGGAHSLGEWWMNEKGGEAIKLALLLVVAEAGIE